MSKQFRVLIADDHAPTRDDIRLAVEGDERFVVCAEAEDAAGAIDAAVRERPDVCLLDIRMPGSGIAAAWEISSRLPTTKVVMLTVSTDDTHLFASLRAGASGYLVKDIDHERLQNALHSVLEGEAALPGSLMARLIDEFRERGPRRRSLAMDGFASRLTSREWQVLDLLRQGLSTAEISQRLVLSPVTVRTHVSAILKKLRVPDREAAVRLFESAD